MRLIKYVIGAVITAIVLINLGTSTINNEQVYLSRETGYTKPLYDYIVPSPREDQIEMLQNEAHIEKVTSFYNFSLNFSGASSRINTLFTADYEDLDNSFFHQELFVSGESNKSGIVLDERAADNLNVSVGDDVTFSLNQQSFTLNVTGIILRGHMTNYTSGLALVYWGNQYSDLFGDLSYDLAFIQSNDTSETSGYLSNYVPLGRVQTLEEYKEDYKENNNQPPGYSEEEWNDHIEALYNDYYTQMTDGNTDASVVSRDDYLTDVQTSNAIYLSDLSGSKTIHAVVIPILYLIIFGVLLSLDYKKIKAEIHSPDGMGYKKALAIDIMVHSGLVLVTMIVGIVQLLSVSNDGLYHSMLFQTTMVYTLPLLVALTAIIATKFMLYYRVRPNGNGYKL